MRSHSHQGTQRFIPTQVGNTIERQGKKEDTPVHPHACGEHSHCLFGNGLIGGSSPRMWGTPYAASWMEFLYRFIPTQVGNTSPSTTVVYVPPVHPHAGGEHLCPRMKFTFVIGSSPRRWGTLVKSHFLHHALRFIPTQVGNTTYGRYYNCYFAVHPHAGGEHITALFSGWAVTVHPHAGGEHNFIGYFGTKIVGSSPRRWGTPHQNFLYNLQTRFIPTQVGNTEGIRHSAEHLPVHPHAGGEHFGELTRLLHTLGSSPRRWGTRNKHG